MGKERCPKKGGLASASLKAVQELLGHASMNMTLRYAHLAPGHLREAVALLEPVPADSWATRGQPEPLYPLSTLLTTPPWKLDSPLEQAKTPPLVAVPVPGAP